MSKKDVILALIYNILYQVKGVLSHRLRRFLLSESVRILLLSAEILRECRLTSATGLEYSEIQAENVSYAF